MYTYKYITLETGGGFWFGNQDAAHREIIDREALDGWRYAGFIPLEFTGHGGISRMDLIFERLASADD